MRPGSSVRSPSGCPEAAPYAAAPPGRGWRNADDESAADRQAGQAGIAHRGGHLRLQAPFTRSDPRATYHVTWYGQLELLVGQDRPPRRTRSPWKAWESECERERETWDGPTPKWRDVSGSPRTATPTTSPTDTSRTSPPSSVSAWFSAHPRSGFSVWTRQCEDRTRTERHGSRLACRPWMANPSKLRPSCSMPCWRGPSRWDWQRPESPRDEAAVRRSDCLGCSAKPCRPVYAGRRRWRAAASTGSPPSAFLIPSSRSMDVYDGRRRRFPRDARNT